MIRAALATASCGLLFLFASADQAAVAAEQSDLDFFEQKIRPVLVERCFKCHSASKPKGGLRLDRRASLLEGGDSGPAVVLGKPEESLLLKAVNWSGVVSEMPPDGKLPERVIADFKHWIARGAAFPSDSDATENAKPRPVDIERGREWWAFQPARERAAGDVRKTAWPRRKVDAFVLAQLERQVDWDSVPIRSRVEPDRRPSSDGTIDSTIDAQSADGSGQSPNLRPAPEADRRTLMRRVSLDLMGLPPSFEDVEEFVADDAPDAYERLVERLLASPQYGERWGRHWLDLARYAEDQPTSEATCKPPRFPFRYRDWVIDALNNDLPYDEFVRRQLAADLMDVPHSERAALGFLGLSPVYHKEPKLAADVISVIVADEWDERLDTVTRTFLGLTVACTRCHDHKFDPIKTEDYYALAGVLASTQMVEWPLVETSSEEAAALTEVQRQIIDLELRFDYAKKHRKTAMDEGVKDLTSFDAEVARWETTLKEWKARFEKLFKGPIANGVRDAGLWIDGNDASWTLLDYRAGQVRDLPVFIRGNPANPGKTVPRRFLEVLAPREAKPFQSGSGRRELADSIVKDAASLTARVIVNRVWGWHFDRPLVTTPGNFGVLGDAPSHPELLDDLTARFIAAGWSLKWLHREIVLSSTYRQASHSPTNYHDRDPDNRHLWRMNRRRLEAESWRDAVLFASGELDVQMGGVSVGLDSEKFRRRTVYATVTRQKPNDLFRLFDFPDAKRHSEIRQPTTTPLQHLYLLNNPFLAQQSAALVESVQSKLPPTHDDILKAIFRRILLRDPTPAEVSDAMQLVRSTSGEARSENWSLLAHSLFATNEFLFAE